MLYNQMLSVGHVPSDWLRAVIVPVFKFKLENYRPISLTCVPSIILEIIISQKIYAHMCTNNILHPSLHGFCRRKSTATNFLECFNDWTLTILSKEQQIVVYIDFAKAFNVVSHPKLIARLYCYGIRDTNSCVGVLITAVRRRRRRPNVCVAPAPFSWSVHVTLYTSYMLLDFCNAVYDESSTLTKSSKNDAGVFCNSPWYSNKTQRRKSKSVFVDNFVKTKADAKSFL